MSQPEIITTQDGSHSLFSEAYGVSYHSKYGAIQESQHVFLEAGLYALSPKAREGISILEVGLGTGLNAFLSLLEAEKRGWKLYYEALEAFPVPEETVRQLNYPALTGAGAMQDRFLALHREPWDAGQEMIPGFFFKKRRMTLEEFESEARFHLIYFDAFAPNAQPELWSEEIMAKMYRAMLAGGILVTYCAKGAFKRAARSVGFRTESMPGPPGKREMTRCWKD